MESYLYNISVVFCMALQASQGCNPVPRTDTQALRRALATAEQKSFDGRIALNMDPYAVHLARGAPICSGPAHPLKLVSAKLGQTAVFSCPLDRCASHNSTCPDFDELLWKHGNHSVWHVLCKGYPSPFAYSQTRTSTTAYLFIHNVTVDAFGPVYCYCQRENETVGLCVNEAYLLRPLLMPADVFETPVLNVTFPAGKNVTLFSKLRIRMTEHILHRYILRYNRRIIWAQNSHPLHALEEPVFTRGGDLALNADNVSMTFPQLAKPFSGQYEVWVRPYMEMDEFVMQTINLKLT